MKPILNTHTSPGDTVLGTFQGNCNKILLPYETHLYRIITSTVTDRVLLEGTFWFGLETYNKICSRVNYERYHLSLTELTRHGLAITTQFSRLADRLVSVKLKEPVWAWEGQAASQEEYFKDGKKVILKGGLKQLWIPNLTPEIVGYRFYHCI